MPQAARSESGRVVFYYDLASPDCYLVAEQIMQRLPGLAEWEPVLASSLSPEPVNIDRPLLERRIRELGLQAARWPARVPADSRLAMLAATYAKSIGRGIAFSLAAFRQAFAAGRDLGEPETVLIAGAACEMHPTALLKALERRSVAQALEGASVAARKAGVSGLPAIRLPDAVLQGQDALEYAAAGGAGRAPAAGGSP